MKLIDKSALVAEVERRRNYYENIQMIKPVYESNIEDFNELLSFIENLEVKEVDLDKQAEWIANGIMIAVQSAKLHTNVYNKDRKDYDHSHLMQAARRGIELGLKIAQKGE